MVMVSASWGFCERLTANALQRLMRHKSYATTKMYINMAWSVIGVLQV